MIRKGILLCQHSLAPIILHSGRGDGMVKYRTSSQHSTNACGVLIVSQSLLMCIFSCRKCTQGTGPQVIQGILTVLPAVSSYAHHCQHFKLCMVSDSECACLIITDASRCFFILQIFCWGLPESQLLLSTSGRDKPCMMFSLEVHWLYSMDSCWS